MSTRRVIQNVATSLTRSSEDLERLLSGFAVNTPEMSRARVRAARTQLRQSMDYKYKQVAEAEHIREHMQDHLPPKK